jgi:catechol 2,3-dioxygenase-like lactoylglutathione lyase family enzyme
MRDDHRAVLTHTDLFHTGIVVDDLEAAKAELGEALGVTWHDGGAEIRMIGDDGGRTVRSAYALSIEGPHHVELVQSIEGTVWTAAAPGQAHHLGYWVDDVTATSAALVERGASPIVAIAMADDRPPMCAYLRTKNGLCVEIVDAALREVLLPWETRSAAPTPTGAST